MADFDELSQGNNALIPAHIGIIMDGNGRWAKKNGLLRKAGHKIGAEAFKKVVRHCNKRGVRFLTVYAFSTENWKRPKDEVNGIWDILRAYLADAKNHKEENVRTRFIGDLSVFDNDILQGIEECEEESADFTGLTLNIAINYGGRNEILNAIRDIAKKVADGEISAEQIDEGVLENHLYTKGQPAVDLIIRPSGEQRTSNFLIWQSAYAEFITMDVLWPDFSEKDLDCALAEYTRRNRRFGGI